MKFLKADLPYWLGDLKPFLSEEQLDFHFNKHHSAYVNKLNELTEGKPEANLSLRQLAATAGGAMFNNAAQAWNHEFFWNCMKPKGGGEPSGALLEAIRRDFQSFEDFKREFSTAAATLFGSGWAWLAADKDGKLSILPLGNAGTPLKEGKEPILTIDVWEHAYYIDYRNLRPKFIEGFWTVVNWSHAAKCYAGAGK